MTLTPMMKQYFVIKENYKDCIVFFRLGDFYEMFFEDAKTASRELELVLTGRDCGLEERAPMCGIPFHAAQNYISKLVTKGYKIAICEQVEDASAAKGIVKRDVIKVITPGTYVEVNNENEYKNTYISTIFEEEDHYSIASADISIGEFKVTSFPKLKSALMDEISKINPKEVIVDLKFDKSITSELVSNINAVITTKDFKVYCLDTDDIFNEFTNLKCNNLNDISEKSSSILLKYIYETQKIGLSNINNIDYYEIINYMSIDSNSRRNLELTENLREKNKKGSLLWILDKTGTSMGGRTLRKWIEEPLIIKEEIIKRLDGLEELYENSLFNDDLRDELKEIYDVERIVGKIANKSANAKDLVSLRVSLEKLPRIKNLINNSQTALLKEWYQNLDTLEDICSLLLNSLLDDPSMSLKDGGIIKDNFNKEVDELRTAKFHGKEWIANLESKERDFTGIKSLKVGYNKVFGYYIEISRANYNSIPEGRYIRKQTLSNSERFITQELKEMEEKILGAEEKLSALEYNLFVEIREKIELQISRLKKSASIIGKLDSLSTLAVVSLENNYVKPSINENGKINIIGGRHPVVEKVINKGEFVSNDTLLNTNYNQLLLITGPNMAGKSTYMRQVALITLMAQIGCFVPAEKADISICDKIFTRIGASDDLAGGKSTFMVEMWEVSNILRNATSKSLVLLDEVGRGTSTYDGLSIAWAVIEYISSQSKLKCKTLFATHYHELTKLEGIIDGVKNYSVAVSELNGVITFLHKIVEGGADQSYGIEVAKLAGLPVAVINRAKELLASLEDENKLSITYDNRNKITVNNDIVDTNKNIKENTEKSYNIETKVTSEPNKLNESICQMDFNMFEKDELIRSIANIDILGLTPMDAMNNLYKLVSQAKTLK